MDNPAITSEHLPIPKTSLPIYTDSMSTHLSTGALGEACAASFLECCGYTILDRNFRVSFGELDIVAKDPSGCLVIVEVKTFSHSGSLSPEDNLTRSKFFKLSRVANFYANALPELIDGSMGWRIDLITILLNPPFGTPVQKYGNIDFAVSHYKNISLS